MRLSLAYAPGCSRPAVVKCGRAGRGPAAWCSGACPCDAQGARCRWRKPPLGRELRLYPLYLLSPGAATRLRAARAQTGGLHLCQRGRGHRRHRCYTRVHPVHGSLQSRRVNVHTPCAHVVYTRVHCTRPRLPLCISINVRMRLRPVCRTDACCNVARGCDHVIIIVTYITYTS
jgi:hypothetical protein